MGEGILDNRDTEHRYWLLLEPMKKPLINSNSNPESVDEVSLPSPLANHMSRRLDHSPIQFICSGKKKGSRLLNFRFDKKHTNVLPIKIESSPIVKYFFFIFFSTATTAKDIFRSQSRGLDTPLPNEIHLFNLRTISNSDFTEKPSNSALLILHRQSQSDCGTTTPETEHENISTTGKKLALKKYRPRKN